MEKTLITFLWPDRHSHML